MFVYRWLWTKVNKQFSNHNFTVTCLDGLILLNKQSTTRMAYSSYTVMIYVSWWRLNLKLSWYIFKTQKQLNCFFWFHCLKALQKPALGCRLQFGVQFSYIFKLFVSLTTYYTKCLLHNCCFTFVEKWSQMIMYCVLGIVAKYIILSVLSSVQFSLVVPRRWYSRYCGWYSVCGDSLKLRSVGRRHLFQSFLLSF